jgi:hypothetical protein
MHILQLDLNLEYFHNFSIRWACLWSLPAEAPWRIRQHSCGDLTRFGFQKRELLCLKQDFLGGKTPGVISDLFPLSFKSSFSLDYLLGLMSVKAFMFLHLCFGSVKKTPGSGGLNLIFSFRLEKHGYVSFSMKMELGSAPCSSIKNHYTETYAYHIWISSHDMTNLGSEKFNTSILNLKHHMGTFLLIEKIQLSNRST